MGGGVDAAREPAHDRHAARGELGGEPLGDLEAVRRRAARADDGDRQRILGRAACRARRAPAATRSPPAAPDSARLLAGVRSRRTGSCAAESAVVYPTPATPSMHQNSDTRTGSSYGRAAGDTGPFARGACAPLPAARCAGSRGRRAATASWARAPLTQDARSRGRSSPARRRPSEFGGPHRAPSGTRRAPADSRVAGSTPRRSSTASVGASGCVGYLAMKSRKSSTAWPCSRARKVVRAGGVRRSRRIRARSRRAAARGRTGGAAEASARRRH